MGTIGIELSGRLAEATLRKTADWGLRNAKANLPYIKKTVLDLERKSPQDRPRSVIVFGGGPSLHRKNPAPVLLQHGYSGEIVACDAALGFCLRNGLVPDYVVTVDSHAHRIIRWFGDTSFASRPADDYFARQDLDPIHKDEIQANEMTIRLVNQNGKAIKAIIATSVDLGVTQRCIEAGMDLYWWNPLYDDFEKPDSYARRAYELTGAPCLVTGGNVGSSAYVFADAVLHPQKVGLVGFDLGYAPGTPLLNTQYYYELRELLGDRVAEAYIETYNPYTGETWFSDPTYYWYRKAFLEIAAETACETYNCTGGGILFGDNVHFCDLGEFLTKHG